MYKSEDIRESFLKFFEGKGHLGWPSSSLIPVNDPTLLLIGAGMAPFKPYFKGEVVPPNRRMATCQKCVRADDIDRVGHTIRHHTFFEMLGNFSFGDYYKKESIIWAWEYLTEVIKFPKEKLWITIHTDDDEAYKIWNEDVGVPKNRIFQLKENFWGPIGLTGPCGPCSEICYDLGEKFGCGKPGCQPGCDCDRYLELWNLVFTGLNKNKKGEFEKLPGQCIDTGLGFERLVMVLQDKPSPYETDLFNEIIENIKSLEDKKNVENSSGEKIVTARRIIADHLRSAVFMIGDTITPSNEGRGYVLRRLIRRASFWGRALGIMEPFLFKAAPVTIKIMCPVYSDLKEKEDYIVKMINSEEEAFLRTLDKGIQIMTEEIKSLKRKRQNEFKGDFIFLLYDTYGFPYEMIEEIAKSENFKLDKNDFEILLEEQRERSRKDQGEKLSAGAVSLVTGRKPADSRYVGDDRSKWKHNTETIAIFKGPMEVESVAIGEKAEIVLKETPFYAESGGQLGDAGTITFESDREIIGRFKVEDTQRNQEGIHIHIGEVSGGVVARGNKVVAEIDKNRREAIMSHHTATHLLQAALRKILGAHVTQSGSLVAPEHLRFDFSHYKALTEEEIKKIEEMVNNWVIENLKVDKEEMPLGEAISAGALAFFEEKYGEKVKVITIKDEKDNIISRELCGGTHVKNTSEVGFFKILSENSIGTGLRRIEARCVNIDYKRWLNDYFVYCQVKRYFDRAGKESAEVFSSGFIIYLAENPLWKQGDECQPVAQRRKLYRPRSTAPVRAGVSIPDGLPEDMKKGLYKLYSAAQEIGCPLNELDKFEEYYQKYEGIKRHEAKKAEEEKKLAALGEIESLISLKKEINGVNVISGSIKDATREALMEIVDRIKVKIKSGIVALGTVLDDKPVLVAGVTKDLTQKGYHAGKIISQIAEIVGGKGGGRPDFAQAGGKDKEKLEKALEMVYDIIKNQKSK